MNNDSTTKFVGLPLRGARPLNKPPEKKLVGSHEGPRSHAPMYVRWDKYQLKEKEMHSPEVDGRDKIVENCQVPYHPKLVMAWSLCWRKETPAIICPEPVRSRPVSNVFLALVFALAACSRRS